jgi:large subunit ribosomal protein L9
MAQAILLQDVDSLGERGHVVDVAPGYLRNYLVPRKLAQAATAGALEEAKRRMEAAERAAEARRERETQAAGLLSKTVLTIHQRAGEDGKLFGSVGPKEIVDALQEARGLRFEKKQIQLEQPLRELGTFMVEIQLSDGTTAAVKTIISEEK